MELGLRNAPRGETAYQFYATLKRALDLSDSEVATLMRTADDPHCVVKHEVRHRWVVYPIENVEVILDVHADPGTFSEIELEALKGLIKEDLMLCMHDFVNRRQKRAEYLAHVT